MAASISQSPLQHNIVVNRSGDSLLTVGRPEDTEKKKKKKSVEWVPCENSVTVYERPPPNVRETVAIILRHTFWLWKFSGFRFDYATPDRLKWVQKVHIALGLLVVGTLVAIVSSLSRLLTDLFQKHSSYLHIMSQCLMAVQFVFSVCYLIYLQMNNELKKFLRHLQNTSAGIGMARSRKSLRRAQTAVLIWHLSIASGWVFYFAMFYGRQEEPPMWLVDPAKASSFKPLRSAAWNPLLLYAIVHAAIGWVVAKTLTTVHSMLVMAELHSLNQDLKSDDNCWQVAVVKHYFAVHGRLLHAQTVLNHALAPFHAVTLLLDTLLVSVHFYALVNSRGSLQPAELIFLPIAMSITFVQLFQVAILSMLLDSKGRFIFEQLHRVSTTRYHWEQECFAVCLFYHNSYHSPLISLYGCLPLTAYGMAKALALLALGVCLSRAVYVFYARQ